MIFVKLLDKLNTDINSIIELVLKNLIIKNSKAFKYTYKDPYTDG